MAAVRVTHTEIATAVPEDVVRRTAGVVDSIVSRAKKPRKSQGEPGPARGGLALDSLGTINLIIALEEEFGLEIDETAMPAAALESVATLAEFVHAQARPR